MNEEYIYVKTNDVQKDMYEFVNQFGDEISSLSYVGNTIKLKNGVVYRFTYNTIGIRKYYTYIEIYIYHLEFKSKKLKQENQKLKGSLQTHEILLKANVEENQKLKADYGNKAQVERDLLEEENKQLKEQLQQKENIINKANNYVIDNANIYLNFIGNKVGFFKENDGKTPIELLEILDNKGE